MGVQRADGVLRPPPHGEADSEVSEESAWIDCSIDCCASFDCFFPGVGELGGGAGSAGRLTRIPSTSAASRCARLSTKIPSLSDMAMTMSALVMTGRLRLGGIGFGLKTGVVSGVGAASTPLTMPREGSRRGNCLLGGVGVDSCAEQHASSRVAIIKSLIRVVCRLALPS